MGYGHDEACGIEPTIEQIMIDRLKLIITRQLPTDYLCKRMAKNVEAAKEVRLQKWLKELEGKTPEEIEAKIKEWENKSETV